MKVTRHTSLRVSLCALLAIGGVSLVDGCGASRPERNKSATSLGRPVSTASPSRVDRRVGKGKPQLITAATPRPQSQKLHIVLITTDGTNPLLPALRHGALQAAQQLRWVQLTTLTPSALTSSGAGAQARLLQKALDQHVNGILLWPASQSASSWQGVTEQARKAKVPIVTLQNDLPGSPETTHCGADDMALGAAAGREAIALLAQKGNVAILAGDEKNAAQQKRIRGVRQSLQAASKIRAVGFFNCNGDTSRALQIMAKVTKTQKPAAWIVLGNWPLLSDNGLGAAVPQGIKIVALDPLPATWRWIENQRVQVCLGQKPFVWGEEGVKLLVKAIDGQKLPSQVDVGFERVTPPTLNAYKARWQTAHAVSKTGPFKPTARISKPKAKAQP